jgi:hypothetical protein
MIMEFRILRNYYFFLLACDVDHPGVGNLSELSEKWRKPFKINNYSTLTDHRLSVTEILSMRWAYKVRWKAACLRNQG